MLHALPTGMKRNLALGFAAAALALLLMPKASRAMTISPPMLDFTLNPGDVVSDVIQVYNEEAIPFKIQPVGVNFYVKAGDETTGAPDFYPADEVQSGYELAPWFQLGSESTVIAASERVNIPFSIIVPEDAAPGSRFGAIQIIASRPDEILPMDASNVEIKRGTSVLIFVRISGDVRDEIAVSKFGPQNDVLSHLPVDFTLRLTNSGSTHQRPVGNIIIHDMWGRQVASLVVNPGPQYRTVLPNSSRRYDLSWAKKKLPAGASEWEQQIRNFAFGKYTATLLVNYGSPSAQKNLTAVTSFVVIPWLALLTYAGSLLAVLLILALIVRGYNRMLINRYEYHKTHPKKLKP